MSNRTATLIAVTFLLIGIGVLTSVVCGFAYIIGDFQCGNRWSGAYQSRYELWGGCKVNVNGKWFPEDRVRATE